MYPTTAALHFRLNAIGSVRQKREKTKKYLPWLYGVVNFTLLPRRNEVLASILVADPESAMFPAKGLADGIAGAVCDRAFFARACVLSAFIPKF